MNGPTHIAGGVAAGAVGAVVLGADAPGAAAVVVGSVMASKAPDVDRLWGGGPKHRSYPHSLLYAGTAIVVLAVVANLFADDALGRWFAVTMGDNGLLSDIAAQLGASYGDSVSAIYGQIPALFFSGVALGYLSHLALDSMTKERIFLAKPGGRRIGTGTIKTGSAKELAVRTVLTAAGIGLLLLVYGVRLLTTGSI